MPDIHDQLAWEQRMVDNGIARYRAQQDKAVEADRAHETSAGANLLRAYVQQVSEHIGLYLAGKHPDGRRRTNYAKLLGTIDTDKVAFMTLKTVIATLYSPKTTQTVCIAIGKQIEDDLQFTKFQIENKEYFDTIVRRWEQTGTTDYKHRRFGLRAAAADTKKHAFEWEAWTRETHLRIGQLVISLTMEVCDLIQIEHGIGRGGRNGVTYITPTQTCIDWVTAHNEFSELTQPDRMPCLITPADWVSPTDGGYYSPQLRKRTQLVKTRGVSSERNRLLASADMPKVYSAVNAMQRTAWTVNHDVLRVMRAVWHQGLGTGMPSSKPIEIPRCPLAAGVIAKELQEDDPLLVAFKNWKAEARELHTLEKERVAQGRALHRVLRVAAALEDREQFFYVYTLDFRGRVYCATAGLSPQGTDHGKALIRFANGKRVGETGKFWLLVHGANKFGYDRVDYADRVEWIMERKEQWLAVASDPIAHRGVWADADKPYQFLAWCFEFAGLMEHGADYVSHLPVGLDGSCNGLQHFSAMLRDEVGGRAVNLIPGDIPADIYQDVGDVTYRKVRGLSMMNTTAYGGAVNWIALFDSLGLSTCPRKLPKPPVMTLPYGSTQQACTQSIYKWLLETAPNFFEKNTSFSHALYLSPIVWESIGEVVIAARAAMDWLQQCASLLAKAGQPIRYTSPLGFPMYQATYQCTTKLIETTIGGRLMLRLASDTDKLDSRKQRQGVSPNTVHEVDASHLMLTVDACAAEGITEFAMIHDDYGVHAADTETLHRILREQFVFLHSNHDILQEFKDQNEALSGVELPALPPKGNLDINDVLKSKFFFG